MTLETLPVEIDKNILTPENKCSFCKGSMCCTYVTQEIDTPRKRKDYSHLLWQVSHEHVSIFKDDDGWNLLVEGKCTRLQPNGRCGIYESRPHTCREHKNDYCEFDAPLAEGFDLYFPTYDSLLSYCKKQFKNWDKDRTSNKKKKKKGAKSSKDKSAK